MGEEREGRERRKRKEGTKIGVYIEGERKGMKQGREGRKRMFFTYLEMWEGMYVRVVQAIYSTCIRTYTRF